MTWSSTLGLISSIALFLPVFFILLFKLSGYKTFPALMIYYLIVFGYNLSTMKYIDPGDDVTRYWGITNNLLDTPLMLGFLIYFSTSPALNRRIKMVIGLFLIFELLILIWKGVNVNAITIIMGPGLAIVIGFCLHFFVKHSKAALMNGKTMGKAIMAAALVFAYGCYAIIYLIHYVFKSSHTDHTFLIYFLVTTFSSLLLCAGIVIERKRIYKLNEVKTARKELADIYKDSVGASTFRRGPMLDFDKEPWKN
ncbi:MAG: hypothetical protein HOP10_06920 [Chitinophagaceae bacterium]|nr:hypothetical protein [Chitinophagaceae bacterium]